VESPLKEISLPLDKISEYKAIATTWGGGGGFGLELVAGYIIPLPRSPHTLSSIKHYSTQTTPKKQEKAKYQ
jgi:hypothetical protein